MKHIAKKQHFSVRTNEQRAHTRSLPQVNDDLMWLPQEKMVRRDTLKSLVGIFFLLFAFRAYAVIETYDFASESNHQRYQVLVEELRCPKCQNQNLLGSNSPIAMDLRRELHRMIEEGASDAAIKDFMVKRYGNFVLYRPPLDKNTAILWGLPALLGFIALLAVLVYRQRLAKGDSRQALTETEKLRLQELLEKYPG